MDDESWAPPALPVPGPRGGRGGSAATTAQFGPSLAPVGPSLALGRVTSSRAPFHSCSPGIRPHANPPPPQRHPPPAGGTTPCPSGMGGIPVLRWYWAALGGLGDTVGRGHGWGAPVSRGDRVASTGGWGTRRVSGWEGGTPCPAWTGWGPGGTARTGGPGAPPHRGSRVRVSPPHTGAKGEVEGAGGSRGGGGHRESVGGSWHRR